MQKFCRHKMYFLPQILKRSCGSASLAALARNINQ